VFDPSIKDETDRFAYRFVKPWQVPAPFSCRPPQWVQASPSKTSRATLLGATKSAVRFGWARLVGPRDDGSEGRW